MQTRPDFRLSRIIAFLGANPLPGNASLPPSTRRRGASALLLFLCFTALGIASKRWLGEGYASLIFVLGITVIGALYGILVSVSAGIAGSLLFNLLVADPIFEINFQRATDYAPLLVFMLCAVVSGFMSGRLRDEAHRAWEASQRLERLFGASQALHGANSEGELAIALMTGLGGELAAGVAIFRLGEGGIELFSGRDESVDCLALAEDIGLAGAAVATRGRYLGCALVGGQGPMGVLVIEEARAGTLDATFIQALAPVVTLAMERTLLAAHLAEARAARRAEDLKSALLSSVSHDLRSPLTAINASAATLLAFGDTLDADTSRELVASIVEESDRLNQLTTNLLQMTRLQAVDGQLPGSVLPAAEMIRNVLRRQRVFARARDLVFEPPRAEVQVLADTALFDLVLTNVIQNAIRYSPDRSTITMACAAADGAGEITVTDEGPGIPPEAQERVFERFYRLERDERAPRGSGLGLAIARGFVEASGGSISITSPVSDGRGTRITIRLPLAEAGAELVED